MEEKSVYKVKVDESGAIESLKKTEEGFQNVEKAALKANKTMSTSGGKSSMNEGIDKASKSADEMGKTFEVASGKAGGAIYSINSGLKSLYATIIANPIIAILTVVIAVFALFAKGVNSSEEATGRFQKVLAPLRLLFDKLLGQLQKFVGFILDGVEAMASFAMSASRLLEKLPFVGDTFKNINDQIEDSVKLQGRRNQLIKDERTALLSVAKNEKEIADLRAKAEDKDAYKAKERLEFIKEANKLEKENADEQLRIAKERTNVAKEEAKRNQSSIETNDELVKLQAEEYKAEKDHSEKMRTLKRKEQQILNEISSTADSDRKRIQAIANQQQKAIDAQLELINSEKKASFERRQARLDNEQALLDIEKDSAEKRARQIQLNYEKELLAIERYEQELIEAKQAAERKAWEASGSKGVFTPVAGSLGTEDQSIIDNRRSTNDKKLVADQQEVLNGLLNQYQDYDAKRKAIETKYSDDVAALTQMRTMENREEVNAAIAEAKRLRDESLSSINLEEMQDDINWDQVFGRMEESSTVALENLKEKLETYLSDAGSSISPENFNVLSNAIKQIDDALNVRNPFKNFIDGFKELKKAGKGTEEQYKSLSKMQKGIEGASSFVSGIASDISSVTGDASKEVEDITNLVQSGFQAGQGAARVLAGDMTGLLDLAQGIAGLIGSIGSLFGGEDESVLRAIEQYKGMVSALDAVIDRQTKLLSMMTGEAATKQADVTKEMIRQQAEYEKEVLSNWFKSGKSWNHHSMAYRINRDQKDVLKDMGVSDINQVLKWSADQWDAFMRDHYASWAKLPEEVRNYGLAVINAEEQTTDLGKTLEEINTGVSFDSFKDSFVDSLMDLDSTAKDVAGNIEKYFQKAMLKSLVDTKYDKQIRALYDKFSEYNSVDGIDETEYANLQRAKEELAKAITDERDTIMKTFGWESEGSDNSLKGAVTGMSQEQAGVISGHMAQGRVEQQNTRIAAEEILELLRSQSPEGFTDAISPINDYLMVIRDIQNLQLGEQRAIKELTVEVRDLTNKIEQSNEKIATNTDKVVDNTNNIARHTEDTAKSLKTPRL